MKERTAHIRVGKNLAASFGQKLSDYLLLVKFRLTFTVVFSSAMAYLIGASGTVDLTVFLPLVFGGFLVTGAANALNQVLERDYDKLMKRTADRPLAAQRMQISEAVLAAGLMALFGIGLLAFINPWTAFFGTIALVMYAFLYTPLKRVSPASVVVGAIPGALPTLIGCLAAEGQVTYLAIALFGIQFFWQFPHFWSIGFLSFSDYQKAGYQLIPKGEGDLPHRSLGLQSVWYGLFLLPVAAMPYLLGEAGMISAVLILALTMGYIGMAFRFYRAFDRKAALQLMFYSFAYLPLALVLLVVDKV